MLNYEIKMELNPNKNKILIAGGSGLVGQRLVQMANENGWSAHVLSRKKEITTENWHHWDPASKTLDIDLSEFEAIVNLAGAGVMDKPWSSSYKQTIIQSRVQSAETIGVALRSIKSPPILINASAIGWYGYTDDPTISFTEETTPATGDFLQEVCKQWENAAFHAGKDAERCVVLRIGIVLSSNGGALKEMLRGFKLGIGSYFAPGDQAYSWIHMDDLCRMILFAIEQRLSGTYNAVAPSPCSAKEMARCIAKRKYGSARVLPVPMFASKLMLGAQQSMLTGNCPVSANKIANAGFQFTYSTINEAISHLI